METGCLVKAFADKISTVEEAVEWLMETLSQEEKEEIAALSEEDLIELHLSLGMAIRNEFGLWRNSALLADCGRVLYGQERLPHPDDASMAIIKALWKRLRH
jgi:hypothetical protein